MSISKERWVATGDPRDGTEVYDDEGLEVKPFERMKEYEDRLRQLAWDKYQTTEPFRHTDFDVFTHGWNACAEYIADGEGK